MKKQILHSLFVTVGIAIAGCSKEVKSPSKSNNTSLKISSATLQPTDTNGHTCGGNNQSSNNNATY